MKKRVLSVFNYILLLCLFIPSVVCASEDKYTAENFDLPRFYYNAKIKPGDYSKFYFSEYDSNQERIVKEYNWNGELTEYNGDQDELDYYYPTVIEYGGYDEDIYLPYNRTLMIAESEEVPLTYYSYVLNGNNKIMVSDNIYLSASKGESIGSLSNYDLSYKVYELAKEDGYDYVTEAGDIILSTVDNGYKIIGKSGSRVTLFNGTTAYVIIYDFDDSIEHKEISASTIKELLSKEDLTGLKLALEFSINNKDYYSIVLGNHTYFVNDTLDDIIYEAEIPECNSVNYYATEYDEKIYVFLDFNKYYTDEETYPQMSYISDYTVCTKVFDLNGTPLFDDTNWLNLYYSSFGTMFGITKVDDRYIMKFLTVDGEVMYSEDYTELFAEFNPYTLYGAVLLADHDTNSIETGKYLLRYNYEDYFDEDIYMSRFKFVNVNEHYVIEGRDQTYNGKDLVIRFNGNFEKFEKLLINDKVVSADNYTKKSGSVIVTLKNDYLNSLEKGTYTVKAVFDGGEADTSIIIPETNPKTGDGIINVIFIGSISLIGLLGTSIYLKKKNLIKLILK